MHPLPTPLGPWLRGRRQALGLTQEALAERAACSGQMIRRLEAGTAQPSRALAARLQAALTAPPGSEPAGPLPVGPHLRALRQAADLSQATLAARVGCSRSLIKQLEAGTLRPSAQIAALLAAALGVPAPAQPSWIRWARTSGCTGAAPALTLAPLPSPLTSFHGREADLAALAALLEQPPLRLLTLTGPPGVGKTRLALALAAAQQATRPAGVAYIPLAPLRDPTLVAPTLAATLGVRQRRAGTLEASLAAALAARPLLLVLDNFEQVRAAAPVLGALLAAAPDLRLLVTSRVRLGVYGESEYPVAPLALPPPGPLPPLPALRANPAVALFVERARAIRPGWALTAATAPAVVALCTRLDGLPLAIELAAARSKLFAPAALLAQFDPALPWLGDGPVDAPPRHQSLHAAIAWSYDLLDPAAQALFRQLAVFRGGATLAAIAAVCPAGPPATSLAPRVTALVDQSLVGADAPPAGALRVSLLETLREFAWAQAAAHGEQAALQQAHARYYLRQLEAAETQPALWEQHVTAERANLLGALAWALAHGAAEIAVRLGGVLWRLWDGTGQVSEGRRWLDAVLAASAAVAPERRVKALNGAAVLALYAGDYAATAAHCAAGEALCRALGDQAGVARALNCRAVALQEQGQFGPAERLAAESLRAFRAVDHRPGTAQVLNNLGELAYLRGADERAAHYYQASLELHRAAGHAGLIVSTLHNLIYVALRQGQVAAAREHLAAIQAVAGAHAPWSGLVEILVAAAGVAYAAGAAERAVCLLSAATALQGQLGLEWWRLDRAEYERTLAGSRAQLGVAGFVEAWAAGQTMPGAAARDLAWLVAEPAAAAGGAWASAPAPAALGERH